MNKDIEKIRKIVNEELKRLKEEDAQEAQERAQYQVYQDMYLTPQSNWKLKKNTDMYDENGNLYRGKLGEIHKIQRVEYDFMHTGEVVTECDGKSYSINADDFRSAFDMIPDEEGLKINNELKLNDDAKNYLFEKDEIKEEIKKLVKIKNYFGKNIKESIEKLEKIYLHENLFGNEFIIKIIGLGMKNYISKYDANSTTYTASKKPFSDPLVKKFTTDDVAEFINKKRPNDASFLKKLVVVDKNGKEMDSDEFFQEYVRDSQTYKDMMARKDSEPEDAYLDQDFEDRISDEGPDL